MNNEIDTTPARLHRLVGRISYNMTKFDFLSFWVGIFSMSFLAMLFQFAFTLPCGWSFMMILYNLLYPPNAKITGPGEDHAKQA
jgi:hypothetical protein